MINPDASAEVSAEQLLDEAKQLLDRVLEESDRPAVVTMVDRLEWKIDELQRDRLAALEADPVTSVADELASSVGRLLMARGLLAAATVFHPVELLTRRSVATRVAPSRPPDPDDGNIYVDGQAVAYAPLFE